MPWSEAPSEFKQPPIGTFVARCISIIDLGTQKGEYQGKPNIARKCYVAWELPNEKMEDGRPFIVGKFYTASLGEKANLRKDLVNWRGKAFTAEELMGFEERNLLDKTCMLSLTENANNKVRVTGVMSKPKEVPAPDRVNEIVYFSLEKDRFSQDTFNSLSDWFKGEIMKSPEWAELKAKDAKPPVGGAKADDFDDDIPF